MNDNRHLILENALPLVPFDGWSEHTLREAAKRSGLTEADVKKTFPGGVGDCVEFFLTEANKALAKEFPEGSLSELKIPARIEKIILTRFKHALPKREVIRRTVSFNSLPWNTFRTMKITYATVDLIWRLAGDNSTDFSFYTRRMTLAGVYSSTLLFWLNDESENQQETALFLKRRLGDVAEFGKLKKKLGCA